MSLDAAQIERYARHILLPEIGGQGQQKLLQSSVLIVGVGGLGAPAALYLSAAGVGRVGLVDFDEVERSNLQRQVLFSEGDVGRSKLEVAAQRLRALNPDVEVVTHPVRLDEANAEPLFRGYDLVVDGSDNFETRYAVNEACVRLNKPNAFGSVLGFEGQASLFVPGGGCYRCLFPEAPPAGSVPSCAEAGVVGVASGLVGCIQAAEALKWLLGVGETLSGRLLLVDALNMRIDEVHVERRARCPTCAHAGAAPQQTST